MNLKLRSRIVEIIDTYGFVIGGVPCELLFYHVNNQEMYPGSKYSNEEIIEEVRYLEERGKIEKTTAYKIKG